MTEPATTRSRAARPAPPTGQPAQMRSDILGRAAMPGEGRPAPRGEGRANAPPPMLHARFARRSPWTCPATVQPFAFTDL